MGLFLLIGGWLFFQSCENDKPGLVASEIVEYDPVDISKYNQQKIFVHYMTWFETKESSGNNQWGSHWTMANKDPDKVDALGKREIASHFYPLIGPYASSDPDVIEYHLLLMKYAGIDGVMIDWYGVHDVYDYSQIKANTETVVELLEKVGLKFTIVYEDRTTSSVVDQGKASSMIEAAKKDMEYLQLNFFQKKEYVSLNQQPLLLVFGPVNIKSEADWSSVFSKLNPKPCFLTLWHQSSDAGLNSMGEYAWVYENNAHLESFYLSSVPFMEVAMGSAYPGFLDYYSQGGWPDDITWIIDHNDGATLEETLQMASGTDLDFLQLITWNDFGEGTIIEPTREFEFSYLEKIQDYSGVSKYSEVFIHIYHLYELRKKYKDNPSAQRKLDQVFYYLVSLQIDKAVEDLQKTEETF